jgi:hypothetical protein
MESCRAFDVNNLPSSVNYSGSTIVSLLIFMNIPVFSRSFAIGIVFALTYTAGRIPLWPGGDTARLKTKTALDALSWERA